MKIDNLNGDIRGEFVVKYTKIRKYNGNIEL